MDFSKYALSVGRAPREMDIRSDAEVEAKREAQRGDAYRLALSEGMQNFDDSYENLTDEQLKQKLEEFTAKRNQLLNDIEQIKMKNEERNNRVGRFKQGIGDFAQKLKKWGTTPGLRSIEKDISPQPEVEPIAGYQPTDRVNAYRGMFNNTNPGEKLTQPYGQDYNTNPDQYKTQGLFSKLNTYTPNRRGPQYGR